MPRYIKSHGGTYPQAAGTQRVVHAEFGLADRKDLKSGRGPMALMLHPEDAAARNIGDGSLVTAFNDLGRGGVYREKSRLWWRKERRGRGRLRQDLYKRRASGQCPPP